MKTISLLLVFISFGVQQQTVTPDPEYGVPRGPVHRDVAENSPVATIVISVVPHPRVSYQGKLLIGASIHNVTNHELHYVYPQLYFEVRNSATGKLPPITPAGCHTLFFSDCYIASTPSSFSPANVPPAIIPPQGTINESDYIDHFYTLAPGEYTVVGIFCAKKREGPECFKSNEIEVTVP
jgi:hypothetical protein